MAYPSSVLEVVYVLLATSQFQAEGSTSDPVTEQVMLAVVPFSVLKLLVLRTEGNGVARGAI